MDDKLIVHHRYHAATYRDLVVPTAVITSTVILTASALKVAGDLVAPRLNRLTAKLKNRKENEEA